MDVDIHKQEFRDFFVKMALPWKLPRTSERGPVDDLRRYRRVWRFATTLTLVVSLVPLIVMTGVNFLLFRNNLRSEMRFEISRSVANVARSLEFTIEERVAALNLLLNAETVAGLSDEGRLSRSFDNLRDSFGGFVDLGLIGPDGVQTHYSGPYNLQGVDYEPEDWYREVTRRGVYLSDVFLGHRQFPHFVIAVRRESPAGGYHVLRATADLELLNTHLSVAHLGRNSDIFIVNRDGVLQTTSRFHGNILTPCTLPVPPYAADLQVIEDYDEEGESFILGYKYLENTPFVLVLIKREINPTSEWLRLRADLFTFLAISAVLIVIVVLLSATALVRQIRRADIRRAQVLHSAEYTNKMATLGRLAASVAHEINNPLAIINEKAGLLRDMMSATPDFPRREKSLASVDSIRNSVDRCSAVTHRLLGFTRNVARKAEWVDLADLLRDVLGFLGKEASHRNITVVERFDESAPRIHSDRGMLQQVFLNLTNNAVAVIQDNGRLTLTIETLPGDRVAVSVEDDGPGVPESDLEAIFEPFYSTKGEFGTGLGLSITYDLVRKLGGTIDVRSTVGEGTVFTVTLPRENTTTGERR